jgi:hypothetical protein
MIQTVLWHSATRQEHYLLRFGMLPQPKYVCIDIDSMQPKYTASMFQEAATAATREASGPDGRHCHCSG